MSNKSKAIKNILTSAIGQIMTIILGLVVPRLFIMSFGSEVNGLLNSINQFLVYLGLFEAGVGTVTLQALYKPVAVEDKDDINSILAATNRYYKKTGTFYLLGLIVFSLVYSVFVKSNINVVQTFLIIIFSGLPNVILFYFQGKYKLLLQAEGKNYIITNLTTIITTLTGLSKILLLYLNVPVIVIVFVGMLISLVQFVYIMLYIKKKYKWIDLNVEEKPRALNQKNFALIHQFSFLIFHNTDVLLLTMFCDLKIVSVYSVYRMITSNLENLMNIFSGSVNFALGQLFQIDKKQYQKQIDVFESLYSSMVYTCFSVALFLFIPFITLYTDGINDINYVDRKLAVLFVAVSVLTLARTPMLFTINFAGHFKLTTPQSITETVINLVVSLVCIQLWGIYGVLLGTVCALVYRTNDIIIYANKKILDRSCLHTYAVHLINVVLLLTFQLVYSLLFKNINNYFVFGAYAIIMVLATLAVYVFAHMVFFKDCREFVKTFLLTKLFNKKGKEI